MKKPYPCKCHVCGKEFVIETEFLSGPGWYTDHGVFFMTSCNADKNLDGEGHTLDEIRDAWAHPRKFK